MSLTVSVRDRGMAWVQEGGALWSREASGPKRPEGLLAAAQGAAMDRAPPHCSPYLAAGPWQDAVRGQRGRAGARGVEGEVPTDLAPVTQPTCTAVCPSGDERREVEGCGCGRLPGPSPSVCLSEAGAAPARSSALML